MTYALIRVRQQGNAIKVLPCGLPDCPDFPNPAAENCYCPVNMNFECYWGWYDEYWHESHDEEGNVI